MSIHINRFCQPHHFCQLLPTQSSPVLSTISTTYVATDEVTTFVNKARPQARPQAYRWPALASLNAAHGRYIILSLANGVFVDTGFTLRQSYRSVLSDCYSASSSVLDFSGDLTGAADYINQWVEDRTNDKIQDIVAPIDVESAALALANAIYFKGQWKCPFGPDRTDVAPFRVSSFESTQVNMMTQTARFRYSLNRRLNCQILELPYKGNRLAMYILLLPRKVDGLASLSANSPSIPSHQHWLSYVHAGYLWPFLGSKCWQGIAGSTEDDGNVPRIHTSRQLYRNEPYSTFVLI